MISFRKTKKAPKKIKLIPVRNYCLWCYSPLPDDSSICDLCGHASLPALRMKYWTQEPTLVELEGELKIVEVIFCVVLSAAIVFTAGMRGAYAGWVPLLPMFLGLALWQTISKLTRILPYFSAKWFWVIFFCLCFLLFTFFKIWQAQAACAIMVPIVFFLGSRFARWKRNKISSSSA